MSSRLTISMFAKAYGYQFLFIYLFMFTAVNNSAKANNGTNRYTVYIIHKSKKALHHYSQKQTEHKTY